MILEERLDRAFAKVPIDAPVGDYVHVALNAVAGWLYEEADRLAIKSRSEFKHGHTIHGEELARKARYVERLGREIVAGEVVPDESVEEGE